MRKTIIARLNMLQIVSRADALVDLVGVQSMGSAWTGVSTGSAHATCFHALRGEAQMSIAKEPFNKNVFVGKASAPCQMVSVDLGGFRLRQTST